MAKPKLYPLTAIKLEAAIQNLVDLGKHMDGKYASSPKPSYFKNYRFHSLEDAASAQYDPVTIFDRMTRFIMRCAVHDELFTTTTRILFNTSEKLSGTTCRFCERDAGVGQNFSLLAEIEGRMAADATFGWILDKSKLSENDLNPDRIVRSDDRLPLICKKNAWNSMKKCDTTVNHKWDNINSALRHAKGSICCQGLCDSSKKNKWSRKDIEHFEQQLVQSRGDTWRLSNPSAYRKMNEQQWFTHAACSNEVKRLPNQIVRYPNQNQHESNTDADCPYCSSESVLSCIDSSIEHYKTWVKYVTMDRIHYVGSNFPTTEVEQLEFICACGHEFSDTQRNLIRYTYYGCDACARTASHAPRAWILDEAKEIVRRRDYILVDNPESYTKQAKIIMLDGSATNYQSILEFVQTLPIHATGFGRITPEQSSDMPIIKSPYRQVDIDLLKSLASTTTYARLARKLGRSEDSVKQQFRRHGIRNDERPHFKRIFHVNDSAFSVMTPESCYFAGIIAADGAITDRSEVKLSLKTIDEPLLQSFATFLQFTGVLSYRTINKIVDGRGIYSELRFRSPEICADLLKNFGIGPRKSYSLPRPNISDETLAKAYMVGLLEGDGHVTRKRNGLLINFVSSSPEIFKWFLEMANKITGKNFIGYIAKRTGPPTYNITYTYAAAEKLKEALLRAFPGYMTRKWLI